MTKEKKIIAPNEANLGRWIIVLLVGLLAGSVIGTPLTILAQTKTSFVFGSPVSAIFTMLTFVPLFWCTVLAIKLIGKTSLKDFVLGVGGSVNKKECLTVFGLYTLGFVLHCIPSALKGEIRFNDIKAGEFAFLLVFALATTWMQTTWEELTYRGALIRWACKNKVGYNKKSVIGGILVTLIFAASHATNPEVTSLHGFDVVVMMLSYVIPGLMYHFASVHFGTLLPGIIMHLTNNFLLFTMISGEVSAMPFPTLFVETATHNAARTLLGTVITYLPMLIYMIVIGIRRKKAAAAA